MNVKTLVSVAVAVFAAFLAAAAPKRITVRFKDEMKVPAYAVKPGNVIVLNHGHFNRTKSIGCVMHELFHIVQQYRKTPKWITEAMADYARNYVWTTKGCPMNTRNRRARSKYATSRPSVDTSGISASVGAASAANANAAKKMGV